MAMNFSERLHHYFYNQLGYTKQKDIAKRLGNYSVTQTSRYFASEKPVPNFLKLIKKHIPDAPIEWLAGEDVIIVKEDIELYEPKAEDLIHDIRTKLNKLEELLAKK